MQGGVRRLGRGKARRTAQAGPPLPPTGPGPLSRGGRRGGGGGLWGREETWMRTGMQTLHASLICAVTLCHGGGGTAAAAAHPAAAGERERGGRVRRGGGGGVPVVGCRAHAPAAAAGVGWRGRERGGAVPQRQWWRRQRPAPPAPPPPPRGQVRHREEEHSAGGEGRSISGARG